MKLLSRQTTIISVIIGVLLILSTPLQSIDVREFHLLNFQKSHATLEPAISNCAEDEFFNEETQLCEKSNDEDSVVCALDEEYDPETQTCYDPESLGLPCDEDEYLDQGSGECVPIPANQDDPEDPPIEPCAEDEFLNDNNECEQLNDEDPEPLVTCTQGEIINGTTGLCEPIVCFPDEIVNFTTGLCDPPIVRELPQSNRSLDYSKEHNLTGAVGPEPLIVTDLGSANNMNSSQVAMYTLAGEIGSEPEITTGLGSANAKIYLWTGKTLKIFGDAIPGNSPIVKYTWEPVNYAEPADLDIIDPDVEDTDLIANALPSNKEYETKLTVTDANGREASKILTVIVCDNITHPGLCKIPDGNYVAIKWVWTDGTVKFPITIADKIKFKLESSLLDPNPANKPVWTVPASLNPTVSADGTEIELEALAVDSGSPLSVQVTYADSTTGSDRIIMEVLGSERTAPTISVVPDKPSAIPGEKVNFISTIAPGNPPLGPFEFEWSVSSGTPPGNVVPIKPTNENAYWFVPRDSPSQTYKFRALVTDQGNAANDDDFEVKVNAPANPDPKRPNPPPKGGGSGGSGGDKVTPGKTTSGGSTTSGSGKVTPETMTKVWNEKTGSTISTLASNKIIKNTGKNCLPLSDTLTLGPNSIPPKNFKVIADFDKCSISNATAILNIPQNPNLKLVVGNFDVPNNVVIVQTKDIKTPPIGNKMLQGDIQTRVVGQDLFTKQMKAITNVDGLILWNDSPTNSISLTKDSNGIISAQFIKPTP